MPKATFTKEQNGWRGVMFWCPGCNAAHGVPIEGPNAWKFNGDLENPTIEPSLKLTVGIERVVECHCIITDGTIHFVTDSPHALSGQTVGLPEWPPEHLRHHDV